MNKYKIINDPIYGFIKIPSTLIFDIIQHPYFQRLRRISQMGLSYLVYPGAHHTRFQHVLGAMHLMQTAIDVLKFKGVSINKDEEEAALIAILLHDMGHGPFSHALEYSIIKNISHEDLSLALMQKMNSEFKRKLSLAIDIFTGNYHKKFLTELISSQIDVDRLDYLRRDSFYSGVIEGQVNSERLIKMMNVVDNHIVIEEKGIYSIEKFFISRRLMYWQVYYHKTGLMFEKILEKVLERVQYLRSNKLAVSLSDHLAYLFDKNIKKPDDETIKIFVQIDDSDILYHLKKWTKNNDFVLSYLSNMIINRQHTNKMRIQNEDFSPELIKQKKAEVLKHFPINEQDLDYLIFTGKISNLAYSKNKHPIHLLRKNNEIVEFSDASDQKIMEAFSHPVHKYFLSFPAHF